MKIILGRYVKSVGDRVNSASLVNSGQDATLDAVISASTLAAAGIYLCSGFSLEAWLAAVISVVIIKSGIDMLRETLSEILGQRVDRDTANRIKAVVTSFPDVYGAYDLVLHNYGPDRFTGSVHIEVSDSMDADALDQLIRDVSAKVYQETGTILTGVGIYSMNTRNPEIIAIRKDVTDLVLSHDGIMQMHGFYLDREAMTMRFDLVVSFEVEDRPALFRKVLEEVRNHYPDYDVNGNMDTDFSES